MARAEQKTIRRSNLTRVMFVALAGDTIDESKTLLARSDVLVVSYDSVVKAAAQVSPDLVHVVVASSTISPQANAVLEDAAREIGAQVLLLHPDTSAADAAAQVRDLGERVKVRRSTIVPSS